MSHVYDQTQPSETSDMSTAPVTSTQPAAFERVRSSRPAQGIGLGGALLVAATASLLTRMYMRRRARARLRRLAWFAFRLASMRRAMPGVARGAAPFGGMGGALLLSAVLEERLRQSQARLRAQSEGPGDRVAAVQTQTNHLADRPHPRDVLLGAAVGLGLAGLVGRAASNRTSS